MPWGAEYLLSKPLATTMNPGRAESQEWPVRYYFCFDHTKCYYHYRSGLDAFCTVLKPIGPPHRSEAIYILYIHFNATARGHSTEIIFFFIFSGTTSYNSVGHFAETNGGKWTTSLNIITTTFTAGALKVF